MCDCLYPLNNYFLAGLIGCIVGTVELLGRYRDDPWAALREQFAWLYLLVNVVASLLAYKIVIAFQINLGFAEDTPKLEIARVLLAGISAMALFRTSLFTMRLGETDIPIGPGLILQVLLSVTDRAIDRNRALPRATDVPELMADVDFTKAQEALPSFCFGIMQNVGLEEQVAARSQVAIIAATSLSGPLKSALLGLMLTSLVGYEVLKTAVNSLGDDISRKSINSEVPSLMATVDFTKALDCLPNYCITLVGNASEAMQKALVEQLGTLSETTLTDRVKSLFLGEVLASTFGIDVLRASVTALGEEIRIATTPPPTPPPATETANDPHTA